MRHNRDNISWHLKALWLFGLEVRNGSHPARPSPITGFHPLCTRKAFTEKNALRVSRTEETTII